MMDSTVDEEHEMKTLGCHGSFEMSAEQTAAFINTSSAKDQHEINEMPSEAKSHNRRQ